MSNRGEVKWGPAPHKDTPAYRPWLILSTDDHPFDSEECIAAAMTTQRHPEGIEVPEEAWVAGGTNQQSYVSPWYVGTFKHATFDRKQGRLSESLVARVVADLHAYTPESIQ